MDLSLVPYVENADIKNLVGETSLSRGRAYASKGNVRGVSWVEDKLALQGRVAGSRAADYKAVVKFREVPSGVALVTDRKATTVSLHREANVTLDVRTLDDGGLRLTPRVDVDGQLVDPEYVGTLGTPVRGLFYWDGGSGKTARNGKAPSLTTRNIHLVPVGDALRTLLDARTPVDVPA